MCKELSPLLGLFDITHRNCAIAHLDCLALGLIVRRILRATTFSRPDSLDIPKKLNWKTTNYMDYI